MRPSSGGSSRMSNWLLPAWARAAIATAKPATGTNAAVEVADDAETAVVAGAVAATSAAKPKFGIAVGSVFEVATACVFAVVGPDGAETLLGSGSFTPARSLVAATAASAGGGPTLSES